MLGVPSRGSHAAVCRCRRTLVAMSGVGVLASLGIASVPAVRSLPRGTVA